MSLFSESWPIAIVTAGAADEFSYIAGYSGAMIMSNACDVKGWRLGNWVCVTLDSRVAASAATADGALLLSGSIPEAFLPPANKVTGALVTNGVAASGAATIGSDGTISIVPLSGAFTGGLMCGLASNVSILYNLVPSVEAESVKITTRVK